MRIRAIVVACVLVACTPDPPDRTKTCEHWYDVMGGCFSTDFKTRAEWVGDCKTAFKGSPDRAVDKETAEIWARMRLLANCAEPLSLDGKGCEDYRQKCLQQAHDLFPDPRDQ